MPTGPRPDAAALLAAPLIRGRLPDRLAPVAFKSYTSRAVPPPRPRPGLASRFRAAPRGLAAALGPPPRTPQRAESA